ncbi:fimbrial protein [Atlantibacter subterranea]|uniref:Fimbrial protein n=1 Tax=Atlantibacter subterraneus TaxID=255519 RepID=A0A427UTI0_9ENTR|nr:fimbrial protein [Atlantibacter subterranea]MDA3131349.1 fimbrial protein [Atlantibacter subterranea]RSB61040.1 fimbrial protein [Atlantibacter subterranea]RSE05486.1 fimbrial protein [Atlantibacter subterranea]RSE23855.1 fimbrial protein [Atlantibacter subterranea]
MKRLAVGYVVLILSNAALAHDGTVYVTGKINDTTCVVAPGSKNFTVDLGSVASKQFNNSDGAGFTPFAINLENCGAAARSVTVQYSGTPDSKNTQLLALTSDASSAAGVGVGIYNQNKSLIPLGDESLAFPLTPNQATATLNFYARYVTNGAPVTPGNANTSATFVLNYA